MKPSESVSLSRENNRDSTVYPSGAPAMDTPGLGLEDEVKARAAARSIAALDSEPFYTSSLSATDSPIITSRPYKLSISNPATPGNISGSSSSTSTGSTLKHPATPTFVSPALHLQPESSSKSSNQSLSAGGNTTGTKAEPSKSSFSNASFLLRTPGNANPGHAGIRLISGAAAGRGLSKVLAQSAASQSSTDNQNSAASHPILIPTMIQPGFSRPSSGVSTPAVLPSPGLHALSAASGPNDFHTLAPSPAIDLNNFGSQGFSGSANGSSSSQVSNRKRRTPPSQMTPTLGIHASPRMTLATPSVVTLTFPSIGEGNTLASRLNSPQPNQLTTLRPPQKLPQPQPSDSVSSDFMQVTADILSQTGTIGYSADDSKGLTSPITESYFASGRNTLKAHNLSGETGEDIKGDHYLSSQNNEGKESKRSQDRQKGRQGVEVSVHHPSTMQLSGELLETTESFSLGFQSESSGSISDAKIQNQSFRPTSSHADHENQRLLPLQGVSDANNIMFRHQIYDTTATDQANNFVSTRLKSRGGTLMLHSMQNEKAEIGGESVSTQENMNEDHSSSRTTESDSKDITVEDALSNRQNGDTLLSQHGLLFRTERSPANSIPRVLHPTRYSDIYRSVYSHEELESVSRRVIGEKNMIRMQKEALRLEMRQKLQSKQPASSSSSAKSNRGLRHFSLKVCETVRKLGVTSYNHVADTLVEDLAEQSEKSGDGQDDEGEEEDEEGDNSDNEQTKSKSKKAATSKASDSKTKKKSKDYYEKNIRRRVYDALNVLMALGTIEKCKKQICWRAPKTVPLNDVSVPNDVSSQASLSVAVEFGYARELEDLRLGLHMAQEKLKRKVNLARTMMRNYIGLKSLIDRNRAREYMSSKSSMLTESKQVEINAMLSSPRIDLPFVIVSCVNGVEGQVDYLNDQRSSALLLFSEEPKLDKDIDIIGTLAGYQYPFSSGLSKHDEEKPVRVSASQLRRIVGEIDDTKLGLTRSHNELSTSQELPRKQLKVDDASHNADRDADTLKTAEEDNEKHSAETESELDEQIRWRLPTFDSLGLSEELESLANSVYRDTERALSGALSGSGDNGVKLEVLLDTNDTEFVPLTSYQEEEEDGDIQMENSASSEAMNNFVRDRVSNGVNESDQRPIADMPVAPKGRKLDKLTDITPPHHPMRTRSSEISQQSLAGQSVGQEIGLQDGKMDDFDEYQVRDPDSGFYFPSSRVNYYQNVPQSTLYQPQSPLDRMAKFGASHLPVTVHYPGRGDPRLRSPQNIGSRLSSPMSPIKLNHYNQHAANISHSQRQNNILFASTSRIAGSSHSSSSVATPATHFSGQTPIGSGSGVGAPLQMRRYDRDATPGASRNLLGSSPNRNGSFMPTPGSGWNKQSTSVSQSRASSSRAHLPHSSFAQYDPQQISTPIHLRQPHALATPDNIGGVMRRTNPTPNQFPFQQAGMNSSDLLSSAISAAAGASLNAALNSTGGGRDGGPTTTAQDAQNSQSTSHKDLDELLKPSATLSGFDPRLRASLHGLPLDISEALKDIPRSTKSSNNQSKPH